MGIKASQSKQPPNEQPQSESPFISKRPLTTSKGVFGDTDQNIRVIFSRSNLESTTALSPSAARPEKNLRKRPQRKRGVFRYIPLNRESDTTPNGNRGPIRRISFGLPLDHSPVLPSPSSTNEVPRKSTPSLPYSRKACASHSPKTDTPISSNENSPYDLKRNYGQLAEVYRCKQVFKSTLRRPMAKPKFETVPAVVGKDYTKVMKRHSTNCVFKDLMDISKAKRQVKRRTASNLPLPSRSKLPQFEENVVPEPSVVQNQKRANPTTTVRNSISASPITRPRMVEKTTKTPSHIIQKPGTVQDTRNAKTPKAENIPEEILRKRAKKRNTDGLISYKATERAGIEFESLAEKRRVWKGVKGKFQKHFIAPWHKYIPFNT